MQNREKHEWVKEKGAGWGLKRAKTVQKWWDWDLNPGGLLHPMFKSIDINFEYWELNEGEKRKVENKILEFRKRHGLTGYPKKVQRA
jgi:hypothetical protein